MSRVRHDPVARRTAETTSRRTGIRSCTTHVPGRVARARARAHRPSSPSSALPSERDAGAAVLVVRLQHELSRSRADELERAVAVAPSFSVATSATRRVHGTCARSTACSSARTVAAYRRIGQHREERLLVGQLAAEGVGDADRAALGRRSTSARALVRPRDDVVDQHAAVDQVDRGSRRRSARPPWNTSSRGSQTTVGTPACRERVAQQLELGPRRHVAPVDDRDARRLARARPTRGSCRAARRAAV